MKFPSLTLPDAADASRARLAIGLVFLVLALTNFLDDATPMSSGRWSWLYQLVSTAFGRYGWAVMEAIVGIIFIVWSQATKRK